MTGKFYYYSVAYIPAFIGSAMAVLIEKPSRRASLAFYVANVASETLFRIGVARGYVKPINNGQVYLFSIAIATIMLLARQHGFEDDPLSTTIKIIVGPEEAATRFKTSKQDGNLPTLSIGSDSHESDSSLNTATTPNSNHKLKRFLFDRHPLCPHKSSCLVYSLKAASRALVIGYFAQLGMKIFAKLPAIWQNPQLLGPTIRDRAPMKLGLFLCTFSATYKALSCCLRSYTDSWTPRHNFIAALLAGPSMLFYPSPTVALYVVWKSLETLFHEAERSKRMSSQQKELIIVMLYALATSQLFYSALMNPRYIKKSYMTFLDRMSQHRLHMINRSVLDVFGTEASAGYEEFFPDLHPKFMSEAFLGSIWIWMLEQKFPRKI